MQGCGSWVVSCWYTGANGTVPGSSIYRGGGQNLWAFNAQAVYLPGRRGRAMPFDVQPPAFVPYGTARHPRDGALGRAGIF